MKDILNLRKEKTTAWIDSSEAFSSCACFTGKSLPEGKAVQRSEREPPILNWARGGLTPGKAVRKGAARRKVGGWQAAELARFFLLFQRPTPGEAAVLAHRLRLEAEEVPPQA